ncbi:MAG: hypothetical protein IKC26_06670 [Clostridia bacterium]|nr:hypothetical protein [Clostridia bacterium]
MTSTRISNLTALTLSGKMYAYANPPEYDRNDIFLSEHERSIKRLCEFIQNQEPVLTEYQTMTGFFNCDDSVYGDAFRRKGHVHFQSLKQSHYKKPVDNLSTFEWQHATADYQTVLEKGLLGIIEEIRDSRKRHTDPEKLEFLDALLKVANALIAWAEKCADRALHFSESVEDPAHKRNLVRLSETLRRVPAHPPETFYEAVLTIYLCFSADPDSVGILDRYLSPFYFRDLKNNRLRRDEAKEYLQELFLMLQAATRRESANFTRGGESHFCIGGYLPNGEDGFNDLSRLILEALVEIPTYIPQVTLRWTKKTPREAFRFALSCERNDPYKRIAFQNDEKRLKCYTQLCGFPFEKAVNYITVGCNEPAFAGTIEGSTSAVNLFRSTEALFHKKPEQIVGTQTFDAFYEVFLKEFFADLDEALALDDAYNRVRARDVNYLSSIFFQGCIEKATSMTQGAGETVIASPFCMGITNTIDALIVVRQFVFDEKLFTMSDLIAALKANWNGYEDMRTLILKRGDFFGNDTDRSNEVARRLYQSLYEHLKGKKNLFGYQWLIGDLTGYQPHFKWFGAGMGATPDGRYAGDALKFGLGQSEGRDREGLSALLNAIATVDPNGIGCGATVTNFMIDEQLVRNDEHFEKTVDLLLTYFEKGGVHFQLTYVSKSDLLAAKENPDAYKHLRVRVSGFSDYFVKLNKAQQDEIITRTNHT